MCDEVKWNVLSVQVCISFHMSKATEFHMRSVQ